MTQVPAPVKLTAPAEMVHTPVDEASMVKATVRPEVAWPVGV